MRTRQARRLPHLLLITDERMGDALWPAIARLPRGAGVIFRHYALHGQERRALFDKVRRLALKRGLILVLAGSPREAIAWRADGVHGRLGHRRTARPLIRSAPAHSRREMIAARRSGADLILLSPIFPTRSHPDTPPLGGIRAGLLAGLARSDLVALGGMNHRRARGLAVMGIRRWAAIDGLSR